MARLISVAVTLAVTATSCGGLSPASAALDDRSDAGFAAPSGDSSQSSVAPVAPATTALATTAPAATAPAAATRAAAPESADAPAPIVDTRPPPTRSGVVVSPTASAGRPVSITIPSIGVESGIIPTGLLDGAVEVPSDASIAGWFEPGPRPGERGPAVVMGHVDSRSTGPGVFYHLRDIEVGAVVTIETTDDPVHWVVRSVEQYPKDEFPTDRVYGAVPGVELRLITCGGSFDGSVRSYRDNIIVFLTPVDAP